MNSFGKKKGLKEREREREREGGGGGGRGGGEREICQLFE